MTIYSYRVKNNIGEIVEGSIEAESEDMVLSRLKNMGYFIIEVKESKKKTPGRNLGFNFNLFNRISIQDLSIFTRQFSTLISSGISLVESLTALSEQTANKRLANVIVDVRRNIESGLSLSESLARHTDIFSKLYISMIGAGEEGGVLDRTLDRLANFLERENRIRLTIRNKTAYPKFVLGFALFVVLALMVFIVPIFRGIYDDLGVQLPLMTRVVIFIGGLFKNIYFYIGLVFLVVAGRFLYIKAKNTPRGRYYYDSFRLNIPKIGDIIKKVSLSRFSRTLGTLISAGVPILRSLDIVKGVSDNVIIDNAIAGIKDNIREGENISTPMSKYKIFPPMMIQMVAVGERSGALDNVLNKIADFYDSEVTNSIDIITTILEPIMLLAVAFIVAMIVISMYLPMFSIYQYIG